MEKAIIILVIGLLFQSCDEKRTELVLLGTVHQSVENFTSDSLYNILVRIAPDLILFEVDSSFFNTDFKFLKTWNSNENISTIKYMSTHDVDVRPYDFTGRNEYRIKIGSRPTDGKALKLLDSLYTENLLDSQELKNYEKFLQISDSAQCRRLFGAESF